jgi:hypothetical protein
LAATIAAASEAAVSDLEISLYSFAVSIHSLSPLPVCLWQFVSVKHKGITFSEESSSDKKKIPISLVTVKSIGDYTGKPNLFGTEFPYWLKIQKQQTKNAVSCVLKFL